MAERVLPFVGRLRDLQHKRHCYRGAGSLIMALCLAVLPLPSNSEPLRVDWSKSYEYTVEVPGFQYIFGDVKWGLMVYTGKEDLIGLETEIQLYFFLKKIYKGLLILGPAGLDKENCIQKYKMIIKLLNKKYGHFMFQYEKRDPIVDDLFYVSSCSPVALGLRSFDTKWRNSKFEIVASLLGDDEGLYIEIAFRKRGAIKKEDEKKKIYKLF